MLHETFVKQFANAWVEAWNGHNLDAILSHYADGFEMTSPVIVHMGISPSGRLQGKSAVRAYWQKALQLLPDLQFELSAVLTGVETVTLFYKGAQGRLVGEVFFFNAQGQVSQAIAHYAVTL